MKSPVKIALALPPVGGPPPDDDSNGDVQLSGSDYPTVFLPSGPTYPSFLTQGFEGDVTFRVKVASADDDGMLLDLVSMSASPPPSGSSLPDRSGMDSNFADAENAAP